MKLSARDQTRGWIVSMQRGQIAAHLPMDIHGLVVTTSSITNEAVDSLRIAVDDEMMAVVKVSDVMVAK